MGNFFGCCRGLRCCDIILLVIGGLAFISFLGMATLFHADSAYQHTACNVLSVNDSQQLPCKWCPDTSVRTCTFHYNRRTCTEIRRCYTSRYPCARILVQYKVGDEVVTSYLQKSAYEDRSGYPECAMNVCHKTEAENAYSVARFLEMWPVNGNVSCYYHEDSYKKVIAAKVFGTTGKAAKAAAVPCIIALLAFGTVAFRLYRWRKAESSNSNYEGVSGGGKIFTGQVLQPPPGQPQQPPGPAYPMQPMPPQPGYPPPQAPYPAPGQAYQQVPMMPPQYPPSGPSPAVGYPPAQPMYAPPPGMPPPQPATYPPPPEYNPNMPPKA